MRQKTGKVLNCAECGKEFYAAAWKLRDSECRRPKFCSRKCKHEASRRKTMPWARPDQEIRHSAGYLLSWSPEHPRASRGRVLSHILMAEQMLGRYLRGDEQVHHKDRDKQNNDPSNLEVLTSSEHTQLHAREFPVQSSKVEIECQWCGVKFKTWRSRACSDKPDLQRKYCSLACRHKSWGQRMAIIRQQRR